MRRTIVVGLVVVFVAFLMAIMRGLFIEPTDSRIEDLRQEGFVILSIDRGPEPERILEARVHEQDSQETLGEFSLFIEDPKSRYLHYSLSRVALSFSEVRINNQTSNLETQWHSLIYWLSNSPGPLDCDPSPFHHVKLVMLKGEQQPELVAIPQNNVPFEQFVDIAKYRNNEGKDVFLRLRTSYVDPKLEANAER